MYNERGSAIGIFTIFHISAVQKISSKFKVQYEFLRNLPFPGRSHKVEEHHAEHLIDLDKEGFHAFLKYLVRRADIDQGGSRIRHWKRFVDLCGICSFKWDFIGKLETVNQDR